MLCSILYYCNSCKCHYLPPSVAKTEKYRRFLTSKYSKSNSRGDIHTSTSLKHQITYFFPGVFILLSY